MAATIVSILALCISVCSLVLAMRREAPYFSFDVSEELSTCTDFEEYALRISNVGGGDAYEIRLSGELEFDNRKIVCLYPGESSVVHVARRIGHDGGWLLIDRRIELSDILPRLVRGGGFLLKNPNGFSIDRLSPHALWFARCFTSRAARRFFWLRPGCSGRRSHPGRAGHRTAGTSIP